ncbi:MAG: hypothetical protein AB1346_07045 [Thermodesulfobacteriota bacterium]
MNTEEIPVRDGKGFIHIAFGSNKWQFEKIDEEQRVPEEVEDALTRVRSAAMYLQKNWKRIHADDRAMGEAGMSADIARIRDAGYSILGILKYAALPGSADRRKYNAWFRVVREE